MTPPQLSRILRATEDKIETSAKDMRVNDKPMRVKGGNG
jgi:hypothetical protein